MQAHWRLKKTYIVIILVPALNHVQQQRLLDFEAPNWKLGLHRWWWTRILPRVVCADAPWQTRCSRAYWQHKHAQVIEIILHCIQQFKHAFYFSKVKAKANFLGKKCAGAIASCSPRVHGTTFILISHLHSYLLTSKGKTPSPIQPAHQIEKEKLRRQWKPLPTLFKEKEPLWYRVP